MPSDSPRYSLRDRVRLTWAAVVDLVHTFTDPMPPDAEPWEYTQRALEQDRAIDRVWLFLKGKLPR